MCQYFTTTLKIHDSYLVYLNFRVDSYVLQKKKKKKLDRESYFLQI